MSQKRPDWTTGAPKWAAVSVLGVAAVGGMLYSIAERRAARETLALVQPTAAHFAAHNQSAATNARADSPSSPRQLVPIRRTININTASAAELDLLPGIGPALAERIIRHRGIYGPFKSVQHLDAVKGIGPTMIEKMRDFASVD